MLSHFLHPQTMASAAVSALASAVWEGTALVFCVALLLRLFRGLSAAARSFIWLNVFLLLVFLHVIPHGFQRAALAAASGQTQSAVLNFNPVWSLVILGVWAMCSLFRAAQLMLSAVRVHRLAARAVAVDMDDELKPLLQIKSDGWLSGRGSRGAAELCVSPDVERPSVLGFFHPRVLLPPALMEELSESELRQVLVHEMEHLRRGDDWTNLVQKVALVFFPLNPALLWVERRLCSERELACDDSVLRIGGARKAYAICLTHLAEYARFRRSLSLVLGAWEKQSELVRRVHRILRQPGENMSRWQTAALTSGLIAGVLAGGLGLSRSPQVVSFTAPAASEDAAIVPAGHFRAVNAVRLVPQAHEQLLKAEMPAAPREPSGREPSGHEPGGQIGSGMAIGAVNPSGAARPATVRHAVQRQPRRGPVESRQAWLLMTEWSGDEVSQRVVFTVAHTGRNADRDGHAIEKNIDQEKLKQPQIRRVTYAAVPLIDGWLIIQI